MNTTSAHPYDYFEALEKLRDKGVDMDSAERGRLKAVVALNASDPQAAALVADLTGDDWANIYPSLPKQTPISTGQAIDIFLGTYGTNTQKKEEEVLEKLIFNPVPDYSSVLEQQENEDNKKSCEPKSISHNAEMEEISALAKTINNPEVTVSDPESDVLPTQENPSIVERKSSPTITLTTPRETPLTLELAKIFVKQGRFDRAHEIISKIILNNPEKNAYFADQLRFLEKLIKIKQAQTGSTPQKTR